ncbi:hypothetical protein ABZ817_32060 [Streptomyces antimycoticus]|uniref:hypothetical protein n=1 Tax=Streptomyces antimycoticus TaxID=68175 RepID=UPI0033F1BAEE
MIAAALQAGGAYAHGFMALKFFNQAETAKKSADQTDSAEPSTSTSTPPELRG